MADHWSPPNFQDIAKRLMADPAGAGRDLDQSLQIAFQKINSLPQSVIGEVPRGVVNGSNTSFTLAATPISGTLAVYSDGKRTGGWRLSATTLTMTVAPATSLIVDYQHA